MQERLWSLVGQAEDKADAKPLEKPLPQDLGKGLWTSISLICRKSNPMALGQEESVALACLDLGLSDPSGELHMGWASMEIGVCVEGRSCQGWEVPSFLQSKRGTLTQKAPSSVMRHKDIWAPDIIHASASLVLNQVEGSTQTKLKNSWGQCQSIPGVHFYTENPPG